MPDPAQTTIWLVLGAAGFVAGVINAVAGGGSLVSFPALLWSGMPSVTANATNALAIWPGSLTSVLAYRRELAEQRVRALWLSLPSALGAGLGSFILLHSSERTFRAIVPWLILLACASLAFQSRIARLWSARSSAPSRAGVPAQLWC